jgi:hypothetical protein
MINKFFTLIAYITLLTALGLMTLLGYWYFHTYNPVEFYNLPHEIENENKIVKSGDYLIYSVDYCKHVDITPQISKSFVDGIVYVIPDTVGASFPIGCGVNRIQIYVPKALPPGVYHLKIVFKYQVNPIKSVTYNLATENFTVVR